MGGLLGINELKEQIKNLENKITKDNEKYQKDIQTLKEKYEKEAKDKIKTEVNPELNEIKVEQQNLKNAENEFKTEKQKLIDNLINKIETEIKTDENNFFKNEIEKLDFGKIDNLLNNLETCEDLDSKINNIIRNYTQTYSEQNNEKTINHLNILLIGNSGAGKTTLINTLLN